MIVILIETGMELGKIADVTVGKRIARQQIAVAAEHMDVVVADRRDHRDQEAREAARVRQVHADLRDFLVLTGEQVR